MNLIEEIKATAEIYGKQMSEMAAILLIGELKAFPESAVQFALGKCRKELRTFPTLADIISRIDDGRPGPEEAWAMIPKDEYSSVVWTEEMAEAFGVARGMIETDEIAARMAFRETYSKLLAASRSAGVPVKWTPSFGVDKESRAAAVELAVQKNRISQGHAANLLPDLQPQVQISQSEGVKRLEVGALVRQIKLISTRGDPDGRT